jgi:hypothetical protein
MSLILNSEIQVIFWTQKLLAISILIQSAEYLFICNQVHLNNVWNWFYLKDDWKNRFAQAFFEFIYTKRNFNIVLLFRMILATSLFFSTNGLIAVLLLVLSYFIALKFRGPFNGGSDYMTMQLLITLCFYNNINDSYWHRVVIWYLTIQVVLSYFLAGWVKLKQKEWRSGRILSLLLIHSNYRVPTSLKKIFLNPFFCFLASWVILIFENLFPLVLFWPSAINYFIICGLVFHLVVFIFFGLNRFFWAWSATYPLLFFCANNSIFNFN